MTALDRCTFAARPGRITGFRCGSQRCRQDNGDADGIRASRAGRGRSGGGACRSRPSSGHDSGTCRRSGACIRECACGTSWCTWRPCGHGAKEVTGQVDSWLERLGLAERAADRLDTLSHGNQQRVQLIAALVNEPALLVLDEPFSGLDPIAIGAMSDLLADLAAGGATVLFSTPSARPRRGPACETSPDHLTPAGRAGRRSAATSDAGALHGRGHPLSHAFRNRTGSRLPRSTVRRARDCPGFRRCVGAARVRPAPSGSVGDGPDVIPFAYQSPTLSELFRQAVAARTACARFGSSPCGRCGNEKPVACLPHIRGLDDRDRRRHARPARPAQAEQHQERRPHRLGTPGARGGPSPSRPMPSGQRLASTATPAWPPPSRPSARAASTCSWPARSGWSGKAGPTSSSRPS